MFAKQIMREQGAAGVAAIAADKGAAPPQSGETNKVSD